MTAPTDTGRVPESVMVDACAQCGFPRREHSYNGACYGLCGEFVPPPTSPPDHPPQPPLAEGEREATGLPEGATYATREQYDRLGAFFRESLVACANRADGLQNALAQMTRERDAAVAEAGRLNDLLNNPHNSDWLEGVRVEAPHQQLRYPAEHDASKNPWDWFWLIGYLAQKAAAADLAGDSDKAKHHTISTGAALLNWHRHISARAALASTSEPEGGA